MIKLEIILNPARITRGKCGFIISFYAKLIASGVKKTKTAPADNWRDRGCLAVGTNGCCSYYQDIAHGFIIQLLKDKNNGERSPLFTKFVPDGIDSGLTT